MGMQSQSDGYTLHRLQASVSHPVAIASLALCARLVSKHQYLATTDSRDMLRVYCVRILSTKPFELECVVVVF